MQVVMRPEGLTHALSCSCRKHQLFGVLRGCEFVAVKTAIEQVEDLRHKLHMMGILVDGPTKVFCDNESVFKSATKSEATHKKKHNAIAHCRTREAVAAGIVRMAWEDGSFDMADVLTKLLSAPRLHTFTSCILDWVPKWDF